LVWNSNIKIYLVTDRLVPVSHYTPPLTLKEGRASRNSPVGYFSEEPDCREELEVGLNISQGGGKAKIKTM